MDKFEKHSVYNVTFELEDEHGQKDTFVLKPIPWKMFPRMYKFMGVISELDPKIEDKDMLKHFNEETVSNLIEIEKAVIEASYPDLPADKVEAFVMTNMMNLIDPLIRLAVKQEKTQPRKVEAVTK